MLLMLGVTRDNATARDNPPCVAERTIPAAVLPRSSVSMLVDMNIYKQISTDIYCLRSGDLPEVKDRMFLCSCCRWLDYNKQRAGTRLQFLQTSVPASRYSEILP